MERQGTVYVSMLIAHYCLSYTKQCQRDIEQSEGQGGKKYPPRRVTRLVTLSKGQCEGSQGIIQGLPKVTPEAALAPSRSTV